MRYFLIISSLLYATFTLAQQNLNQFKTRYPNDDAVQLIYSRDIRLFMQDGKPMAESKMHQEMMLLNEKTASFFSRSKVYHSGYNKLLDLEAFTIMPDGKKKQPIAERKTTSARSNAIFYDDSKETSFDYPSLQAGAVTQLCYSLQHSEPRLLSPFIYASSLPAQRVSLTVTVPDAIEIDYIVKNDPTGLFSMTKERKKGNTIYKWEMNDIKLETHFGDAPDQYYYLPHVILFIRSYTHEQKQNVFGSVADLYAWNAGFLATLNKAEDPTLRKLTDSLTAPLTTQLDKAAAIYKWVQSNIRYVAFENGLEGFRPRQAAEVCSKRYGDCKDMSSIITTMLKLAGIEAYYTWIGTRSLPYAYSDVPLPIVDNHMISVARIDDQWYFLDGTAPHALLQLPPSHIQGKEALLAISDKEYKILTVPVAAANKNKVVDSTFIQLNEKGITGTEKVRYDGYFASDIWDALLYQNERTKQDFVKSRMGKGSNKFMLGKYNISGESAQNLAQIHADFEIPGYGKKLGNEYYLNLHLEKLFENQVLDTARRKVPREFEYLYTIEQHHILDIPEGYVVGYKPQNFSIDNEFYRLDIQYTQRDEQLIATQKLESKTLMLQPKDFEKWNKDLPALQQHYKEQLVLEKK